VAIDPRKLRPSELCRLLNSTPLGEVINESQLRRHRTRAGLRIGDARYVDLVRCVAWLVQVRHTTKPGSASEAFTDLEEVAQGAAALGSRWQQLTGHGQKLTRKQEAVIAALLTERTFAAAAAKAGIGERTLYRWMRLPGFRAAFDRARQEPVKSAIGHLQVGTRPASEVLLNIALHGRRESARIRAAATILEFAMRGLPDADVPSGEPSAGAIARMNTDELVQILTARLRQLNAAQLPAAEKSRLTATLSDAFLRAMAVDDLNKRMEALEAVLLSRKDKER
jgi:transposase-like protein